MEGSEKESESCKKSPFELVADMGGLCVTCKAHRELAANRI